MLLVFILLKNWERDVSLPGAAESLALRGVPCFLTCGINHRSSTGVQSISFPLLYLPPLRLYPGNPGPRMGTDYVEDLSLLLSRDTIAFTLTACCSYGLALRGCSLDFCELLLVINKLFTTAGRGAVCLTACGILLGKN